MLTREENEILTQVGPGTLMGNLLRRYWTPVCLSREIEADGAPLEVRLLGEDLIVFRDSNGKVGLVDKACPHRGASLFYGRNEECGLRCIYHGWKFDVDGNCVDMPNEPRPFADRIKLGSYPVHESGGIVWTYMGPSETITPFRNFGTDDLAENEIFATKTFSSCNWVQSMEGNIDTAHVSFLHQFAGATEMPDDGSDKPGYPSNGFRWRLWGSDRTPRIEVDEQWYGFRYAGLRTTPNGHTDASITAFVMPFVTIVGVIPFTQRIGAMVPIDDHNCWRYGMVAQPYVNPRDYGGPPLFSSGPYKSPPTPEIGGGIVPRGANTAEHHYLIDRTVQKNETFSGIPDFVSQDLAVTESMGPVVDRTKEHLGSTDRAVIKMRSLLIDAAIALDQGAPPLAVGGDLAYERIRGASKILEEGEDWRVLGTDDDPTVQEALPDLATRK